MLQWAIATANLREEPMGTRLRAGTLAALVASTLAAAAGADARPTRTAAVAAPDDHPRGAGTAAPALECGTVVTAEQAAAYLESLGQAETPSAAAGGGPPYLVRLAPHIVRQSDGSGGLPDSRWWQAVADANAHYAAAGIAFIVPGPIDYIDSNAFYFDIDTVAEIDILRAVNVAPNAINIYFTEVLDYEAGALCGISAFTFSQIHAIAMRNSCTANPAGAGNHSTFSHEIGHFFDLFHTHEPAFGDEYADGSNCGSAGDLVCDTPADPQLSTAVVDSATCAYTGSALDPQGDPYQPDPSQLMSYSLKHCRDHFSPESLDRALTTLLGPRSYLILSAVDAPAVAAGPASAFALSAARPNPAARGLQELQLTLPAAATVEVTVFDVRGARVRTIARGPFTAGTHTVGWDGSTGDGGVASPGIYFVRADADGQVLTRKLQRLR
jgi:hypothetical protein